MISEHITFARAVRYLTLARLRALPSGNKPLLTGLVYGSEWYCNGTGVTPANGQPLFSSASIPPKGISSRRLLFSVRHYVGPGKRLLQRNIVISDEIAHGHVATCVRVLLRGSRERGPRRGGSSRRCTSWQWALAAVHSRESSRPSRFAGEGLSARFVV